MRTTKAPHGGKRICETLLGGGAAACKSLKRFKNDHCGDPTLVDPDSVFRTQAAVFIDLPR